MNSDGNTAARRKRHNRRKQDAKVRNREAVRQAVQLDATPHYVSWVLDHRESLGLRFTPLQWTVLNDTYWDPYDTVTRQQKRQALKRHTDKNTIREALYAAETTAFELYYYWRPAHERWIAREEAKKRGEHPEPLSAEDRAILAKHRRARKGRLNPEPKHLDIREGPTIYGPHWQGPTSRGGGAPIESPQNITDAPMDVDEPSSWQYAEGDGLYDDEPE